MASSEVNPADLKYNSEHTWLRNEADGKGRVGVTFFAQKQLRDVVFVELPEIGSQVNFMEPFGVVESAKATNDLYSPVTGKIVEVNGALSDDPGLVNRDPYGQGWMVVIDITNPDDIAHLISSDEYGSLTAGK